MKTVTVARKVKALIRSCWSDNATPTEINLELLSFVQNHGCSKALQEHTVSTPKGVDANQTKQYRWYIFNSPEKVTDDFVMVIGEYNHHFRNWDWIETVRRVM